MTRMIVTLSMAAVPWLVVAGALAPRPSAPAPDPAPDCYCAAGWDGGPPPQNEGSSNDCVWISDVQVKEQRRGECRNNAQSQCVIKSRSCYFEVKGKVNWNPDHCGWSPPPNVWLKWLATNALTGAMDPIEMTPPQEGEISNCEFLFKLWVECDGPPKNFGVEVWKDAPGGETSVLLIDWHHVASCGDCATG